jgi:hypothetical protein
LQLVDDGLANWFIIMREKFVWSDGDKSGSKFSHKNLVVKENESNILDILPTFSGLECLDYCWLGERLVVIQISYFETALGMTKKHS